MVRNIDIVHAHRNAILELAALHGARNVRLFGSTARGDSDVHSDIDLLVDMEPNRSLLDLGGLWMDLHDLLGVEIDLVTENCLRPEMRERVLREARSL